MRRAPAKRRSGNCGPAHSERTEVLLDRSVDTLALGPAPAQSGFVRITEA